MATRWDLGQRRLYLCCGDRPDLDRFLAEVLEGGVDVLQLRDHDLGDEQIRAVAPVFQARCEQFSVPFVLNDRPDLAAELGADGVHVGQDDASVTSARALLGPEAIVGLSTHAEAELEAALGEDVTYLSAGPVTPTPTKPGRPGTGTAYAGLAAARAKVPVFVTGGVTPEFIDELVDAGTSHFVVVRYLTEAADPRAAAATLRRRIDEALS